MDIEKRSIEFIPEEERHGSPKDLFTVWFGANMNMTTLVTGALLFTLGLNLFWSAFAIIVGITIGTIFVASHSVQGPRLGIPQMIQSRAQFGVVGAILPMLFVMFIYFGFSVSNTLIVTQTVVSVAPISKFVVITLFSLATFLVALYGYKLIHRTQAWLTWLSIAAFTIVLAILLSSPLDPQLLLPSATNPATVLLGISLTATFALSCAPYVADYSRYLPSKTPSRQVFWFTYAGITASMFITMMIGALLAAKIPSFMDNSGGQLAGLFGSYSPLMYALIVYALLCINVFNFYGAFMAVVTTLEPFFKFSVTQGVRATLLAIVMLANIAISLWGEGDFATLFLNFIFVMSYALIPWTAINLVDFYLIRKGRYSIADIFNLDGLYGRYNWVAIFAFLVAIVAQIPFMAQTFYAGPVALALGGIDLAWLVGLAVGGLGYYLPMRLKVAVRSGHPTPKFAS